MGKRYGQQIILTKYKSGVVFTTKFLGKEAYKNYLKTYHWKRVKARAKKLFGDKCLNCGSSKIDMHHLTYKNIGFEKPDEVIPLCHKCHEKLHKGEISI